MNLHRFKLYRAYSISFTSSNVGKCFWSWILKDCIKVQEKKRKLLSCVPVLDKTWIQALSRCSQATTAKKGTKKACGIQWQIQTLRWGGGGRDSHPDPQIRGGLVSKKILFVLQASFWSKNKKGGGSPGSATGIIVVWFKLLKSRIRNCDYSNNTISWGICHCWPS